MGIETVFEISVVLIVVLAVLLFFYFLRSKNKRQKSELSNKNVKETVEDREDLNSLYRKLQNKNASSEELTETISLILKHYGTIDDFSVYKEILKSVAIHPNTNKQIILGFDKGLSKRNPEHKVEISKAVIEALNSREI